MILFIAFVVGFGGLMSGAIFEQNKKLDAIKNEKTVIIDGHLYKAERLK